MMKMFALFIFLMSPSVQAYIPPTTFIVGHMTKERPKIHSLEIEGRVIQMNARWSGKETLKLDFSLNRMLAIYTNEKGEVLGQKVSKITDVAPLGLAWIELGTETNFMKAKTALNDLRLDLSDNPEARLTREGTKVMWTWGKENNISVLKDEFLIADLKIGVGEAVEKQSEYQVQEFSASNGGLRLPKVVRIKKAGKDLYQYELKTFKVNGAVKEVASAAHNFSPDRAGPFKEWVELVR